MMNFLMPLIFGYITITLPSGLGLYYVLSNLIGIAMQYLGVPYVWGGASPSGFDCSGLVYWAYRHLGDPLSVEASSMRRCHVTEEVRRRVP